MKNPLEKNLGLAGNVFKSKHNKKNNCQEISIL